MMAPARFVLRGPARFRAFFLLVFALAAGVPACGREGARPSPGRVLVIGLDGATFDLIRPWMEAGDLPVLRDLAATGIQGPLESVLPPLSPPAWTSMITGTGPGRHAIYDFLRRLPGENMIVSETARSRREPPLWIVAGEGGRRVVVLNVPLTSPPDRVNGVMVSGFPHLEKINYTWPASLADELPGYRLDRMEMSLAPGGEDSLLTEIRETQRARRDAALRLLREEPWDLFWVVFTGTDRIQHFYWKYMDPGHPGYSAEGAARFGGAIREFWKEVDRDVGSLLEAAGPAADVLVLSDHGFGPIHREFRVRSLLAHPPDGAPPIREVYTFDVDGSMLYLSVAGRETNGTLPPARYAEVREEIRRRILAARDPETGECPVERVLTREEAFRGRYAEKGPDLVLVPRSGVYVASVKDDQPVFGPPQFTFSAHHEREGILIARGPRLRTGTVGEGPSLLDVAPTVLYLLDLPVPSSLEGSVLTGLVRPEWLGAHPVREGPPAQGGGEETPLTPEEKERLKSVPYIR